LRAIAAIAPADRQYQPRGEPTPLRNTNYFVIEGSMDGDVSTFMGASQYERAAFSPGDPGFKASLYVKDADHTQFNTAWGRDDLGEPTLEFLLDERPLLAPETQRRIAQVYIAAFLQATLNGQDGYRALFQDPRAGRRWLPDDYMAANYADGRTRWLATFDEDLDPSTGTWPGSTIDGRNLTVWKEALGQRKAGSLCKVIALLAWDEAARHATASYRIDLGPAPPVATPDDNLVFSVSDAGSAGPPGRSPKEMDQPLDWSVVVSDASGRSASLPLSHDQLLYPQIKGETRRIGAMNSTSPSEIVFRRYRLPLADFRRQNPALDVAHLRSVGFVFDRSRSGAIALSGVGLAPP
jgi:hypothetical protein